MEITSVPTGEILSTPAGILHSVLTTITGDSLIPTAIMIRSITIIIVLITMEVSITMVIISIISMEVSMEGIITVRTTAPGIHHTIMADIIHTLIMIKTAILMEGEKSQVQCQQDGVVVLLLL